MSFVVFRCEVHNLGDGETVWLQQKNGAVTTHSVDRATVVVPRAKCLDDALERLYGWRTWMPPYGPEVGRLNKLRAIAMVKARMVSDWAEWLEALGVSEGGDGVDDLDDNGGEPSAPGADDSNRPTD